MKKQAIKKALLPASNPNEDLETISRNKLSLLLDVNLFEIRNELHRDKGIDLIVELKKEGYYTNFRFAVQLKSTGSIQLNKDHSVSFPIELSNINYLLNYGMPAYYILYEHSEGKFYIEQANLVYGAVLKKHQSKKLPKRFNVRFSKLLTSEAIQTVYKQTFDSGQLLRRINSYVKVPYNESLQFSGIVIDDENEVYSVEQNIAFINQFGLGLLNRGEFARIIEIEQRTLPRSTASPIFHFVCGMAYYQRSNLFKALELLKLAQQELSSFNSEIRSMLIYTLVHAKYLLGMVDEQSFKSEIANLLDKQELGSFLQLEKVYKEFWRSEDSDKDRLSIFYKRTEQILLTDSSNTHAHIVAYARLLDAEQLILVNDLSKNMVYTCGRVKDYKKTKTYAIWKDLESQYTVRLDALFEFAFKEQDYMSMSNLGMDRIKWVYVKIFLNHVFENWNSKTRTIEGVLNEMEMQRLENCLISIDILVEGYERLKHFENMTWGLSLKYELLHYMDRKEGVEATAKKIGALITAHDLNGMKSNFNKLISGGTRHERYIRSFTDHLSSIHRAAVACGLEELISEDMTEEMLQFAEKETKWSIESFFEFKFPEQAHSAL